MPHASHAFHLPTLATLVVADLICIGVHVASRLQEEPEPLLLLSSPRGLPELFQYLKEALIAGLLLSVGWRKRVPVLMLWAGLFTYLLFDDLLELHERFGYLIAVVFDYPSVLNLRPRDLGEVTVSLIVAGAFLAMIFSFARRCPPAWRDSSLDLACLLALLGFFGVFVDTLHMAMESLHLRGLTLLEDGGEMITMSAIAAYAICLHLDRATRRPGALWRAVRRMLTGHLSAEPITSRS